MPKQHNILVTGGLGFIGSHTVVELHEAGYTPIIIDNLSNSDISVLDGIEAITNVRPIFYEGDFQDTALLQQIIDEHPVAGVIHFAAFKAVNESISHPLDYYQNNVSGLVTLLQTQQDKAIYPFVFSSSCTVYGEPDTLPVTENAPLKQATSPYGSSKQIDEQVLQDTAKAHPFKVVALRYFNPIGAHPSAEIGELPKGVPANLVPFVTQAAAGLRDKLVVNGNDYDTPDGTCIRDYIHVVDLAKAHIKALEFSIDQAANSFEVINIGTGNGNSITEVLTTFKNVTGVAVPHEIGPRRDGDIVQTYADASKAKQLLDWEATKSLADALADAWRWQQKLGQK